MVCVIPNHDFSLFMSVNAQIRLQGVHGPGKSQGNNFFPRSGNFDISQGMLHFQLKRQVYELQKMSKIMSKAVWT